MDLRFFRSLLKLFLCICFALPAPVLFLVARVNVSEMQRSHCTLLSSPPGPLLCRVWVMSLCYTTHTHTCSVCFCVCLSCAHFPLLHCVPVTETCFSPNFLLTWLAYSHLSDPGQRDLSWLPYKIVVVAVLLLVTLLLSIHSTTPPPHTQSLIIIVSLTCLCICLLVSVFFPPKCENEDSVYFVL